MGWESFAGLDRSAVAGVEAFDGVRGADDETAARAGLDDLTDSWAARYPAIIRLWQNAWAEFIPFLDYYVLPHRTGRDEVPLPGHPIPGPDRERPGTMDHEVVESAWGAVPALLPVCFPRPLAEPGVRLSTHPALHGQLLGSVVCR